MHEPDRQKPPEGHEFAKGDQVHFVGHRQHLRIGANHGKAIEQIPRLAFRRKITSHGAGQQQGVLRQGASHQLPRLSVIGQQEGYGGFWPDHRQPMPGRQIAQSRKRGFAGCFHIAPQDRHAGLLLPFHFLRDIALYDQKADRLWLRFRRPKPGDAKGTAKSERRHAAQKGAPIQNRRRRHQQRDQRQAMNANHRRHLDG